MTFESLKHIKQNATYYQYQEIGSSAHIEKVRFFQENKTEIENLDFDLRFAVWSDYAMSMFELGRYREFTELADEMIPLVISENIYEVDGKDIYTELLFRKAASHYNIIELEKANHVFIELYKIDDSPIHERALKQSLYKVEKSKYRNLQAASILVFIITAVIIAIELLIITPFYLEWAPTVEAIRVCTFGFGLALLLFQELWVKYKINNFVLQLKSDKSKKKHI